MTVRRSYGKRWDTETPFLQFRAHDGSTLGAIWRRDGVFSFEGNADKSMKVFMAAMNHQNANMVPRAELDAALAEIDALHAELDGMRSKKGGRK